MTEPPQDDQWGPSSQRPGAPGTPGPYGPPPAQGPQPFGRPAPGPPQQPFGPPYPAGGTYGPSQYGPPGDPFAPPYGQPFARPAGQPQKSRVGLIAVVTAGILLLIAGAVVLALTLGPTVLDPGAVQRDVAAQFEQREGVGVALTCPADMAVEKGARYSCTGTTDDGEDVTLQITIVDEADARYSWTEP